MLDIMQPGIPTATALPIFAAIGSHESFIKKVPTDRFALKSFHCTFGFIFIYIYLLIYFAKHSHLRANVTRIWHLL